MQIEIDIEAPWPDGAWEMLAARAATAACALVPELANPRLQTSILFTSDEEVQTLNREWREKDKPTNVLSFPMLEREELLDMPVEGPPGMLGDIALAFETCRREAEAKAVSLSDHAAHLIVHGLLHLAGYDHDFSEEDALVMEELETKVLAQLGIADPYGDLN